jgi:hypothetical protein
MMAAPNYSHWMKCHANRITRDDMKIRLYGLLVIFLVSVTEIGGWVVG